MTASTLPRFLLTSEAAEEARVSDWDNPQGDPLRADEWFRRIGRCVRILDTDLADWMRGDAS